MEGEMRISVQTIALDVIGVLVAYSTFILTLGVVVGVFRQGLTWQARLTRVFAATAPR